MCLSFLPSDGFTPLMIASCSGGGLETGNSEEEEDASANVINDFIYQGANLHNQTDRTGETALHLAARYARSDAAKRLLEASADANIQDNMGRTPLHAAVAADAQGVFQVGFDYAKSIGDEIEMTGKCWFVSLTSALVIFLTKMTHISSLQLLKFDN